MDFARQLMIALSLERDKDGMMVQITSLFEKELDYDRGMIFLANKAMTRLEFYGGFGYTQDSLETFRNMRTLAWRRDSNRVFTVCFRERKPFLINDINEITGKLSPRSLEFVRKMGTKAFICVPIVSSDKTLGVLAVDNMVTKASSADRLGPADEYCARDRYGDRERSNRGRQRTAVSLDIAGSCFLDRCPRPATAGHSERVTRFAVGIAREMQLPHEAVEMIRVAALLHDYGEDRQLTILKKPGKLTDSEYTEIKTHAVKTKQILDKIEFQGIYREVPEIASSHHEKFDGQDTRPA